MFERFRNKNSAAPAVKMPLDAVSAFLRRLFPSFGRRTACGGSLEHLATLPLTAQGAVALIRWRQQTLLLGITARSITVLSKDPEVRTVEGASSKTETDRPPTEYAIAELETQ